MSTLYKLPGDGSWIDLSQVQALVIENSETQRIQIQFLNGSEALLDFGLAAPAPASQYADNLANEINKRRGTDIVEHLLSFRHALLDIKDIASHLSSANPHVKERLQAITRIVDEAMK